MLKNQGKKYFLYTRVSKDDYEKSLDNQLDIIKNLASKNGVKEEDIIVFQEEESGSKKNLGNREKFDEMIDELIKDLKNSKNDISKRKYGGIYFFKIDRLARNDQDFQKLFHLLDNGYEFVSGTETIENTPTGRILFRMLSAFAIYESEKLSNRESLAQIHNIMRKNFKSLGGGQIIFGYALDEETGEIKINKEHQKIILRIYDLFLQENKISDIADKIEEETNGYLANYLRENNRSSDKKRFVRNIIENNNQLRYNGYIRRSLRVNDELIKNYIDAIQKKGYDIYGIDGVNKIGSSIEFVFYYPELAITTDMLYTEVKKRYRSTKMELIRQEKTGLDGLFTGIVYFKIGAGEATLAHIYGKKKYFYYRKTIDRKKSFEISQIEIENRIKDSKIIREMHRLCNYKNKILETIQAKYGLDYNEQKKSLNAKINIYKYHLELSGDMVNSANDATQAEYYSKQNRQYLNILSDLNTELKNLESQYFDEINRYFELMQLDDLFSQPDFVRKAYYTSFFEGIIFDENKKIYIVLPQFIVELLGMPKIISI